MAERLNGVSAIILTPDNEILLQHRDNKPDIESPDKIGFFGGGVEDFDVSPLDAISREIPEELEILGHFVPFATYRFEEGGMVDVFILRLNCEQTWVQHEGQAIIAVNEDNFAQTDKLIDFCRRVLEDYYC